MYIGLSGSRSRHPEIWALVGNDSEAKLFMQMLTLDAAKHLNYDREVAT